MSSAAAPQAQGWPKYAATKPLAESVSRDWKQVLQKVCWGRNAQDVITKSRDSPVFGQAAEHVFVGSLAAAADGRLLKENRVVKVLTCVSYTVPYAAEDYGIQVVSIPEPNAPQLINQRNFEFVWNEFEQSRVAGTRCMIACPSGANKAGCLAAAYLMWWRRAKILSTVALLADRLGPVLTVERFMTETLLFAYANGALNPRPEWAMFETEKLDAIDHIPGQPWERVPPEVFADDADHAHTEDRCKTGLSPQEKAELRFARQNKEQIPPAILKGWIEQSDLASDGGNTERNA